jgi:hypothetical protein
MPKEEWLTYEREWSGSVMRVTQLSTEPRPRTGFSQPPRPATKVEITEEKAKRAKREQDRVLRAKFEERQDYKDAKAIHDILEWMEPNSHPLDRLTPAEWAELRRRLTDGR